MGDLSDFQLGQTVELQDGQTATVQFVGQTQFAAGGWIGVVLDNATGKNDGSVQGQRYFDCPPRHGMFVRPTAINILDQPTPKANGRVPSKANGEGPTKRQSVAAGKLRRESVMDAATARRQSINAGSPTPSLKVGGVLRSPTKSPTKLLGSNTSSGNSTPHSMTSSHVQKPSVPGLRAARPSMGPPTARSTNVRPPRPSIAGAMNGSARQTSITSASSRTSSNQLSMRPGTKPRLESISGESQVSASSDRDSAIPSPEPEIPSTDPPDALREPLTDPVPPALSQASLDSLESDSTKPNIPRPRSPPSKLGRQPTTNGAISRELEDTKTKVRVLEKKRLADRDKLKTLERVQSERDRFEGIIQKLQSKYQPQQQEITELRKQLKETDAKIEGLENQQAESDTAVEVATLDREMAEETAEKLQTDFDMLKKDHEELKLEVEVLREENSELGKEMSTEEKTSQGWLQMERSNERLREALMRLRDVSQEQELELREQIAELEADLHHLKGAKEQQVQTQLALTESESTIKEIRQQLEVTLGAEDMIEELTDKNLALHDQVEDLKAIVEELESLKELNDELEINHTENAKQMQDEIDYNESLLADQARNAATRDQTIQDLEYTVTRFRDLVTSMQTDLEEMRMSQQLTEAEANDLTSRSRAMMDLNMRLQSSATKAQVKVLDLELGKLEAQESAEHLSIIQHFLPGSFKNERHSVGAYLRIKRIKFKSDLLHGYVKDKASAQPTPSRDHDTFTACEVMDRLIALSCLCNRFVIAIQSCDLEAFSRLESAFFDVEPIERAFNGWIDSAKRDELKQDSCAAELSRYMALMTHLAEVHITDSIEHYADDVHARALAMQGQLESTLVAFSHTKAMVEAEIPSSGADEGEEDVESLELGRLSDMLVSQIRSAKVIAGKAVRHLDDMHSGSLTLSRGALPSIEQSQASIAALSDNTLTLGRSIARLLSEESRSASLTAQDLSSFMASSTISISSLGNKIQNVSSHLQTFHNLTASLNHTVEFTPPTQPPPWQLLAQKLASETITSASHEVEVSRLSDESREKSTALALRDKTVEELNVKLETLEKRASEFGGRRERVRELENVVEAAKQRDIELTNTVNRLRSERDDLRSQRQSWTSSSAGPSDKSTAVDVPIGAGEATSEASLHRIAALESEIQTLEAAVRHLRSTSYTHNLSSAHDFLNKPLIPQPSPQQQRARLKQSEGKSIVSELLRVAVDPANGVPKLRERKKEERLSWRPVRETCRWQVGRAREEWEGWREWRDEFAGKKREQIRSKKLSRLKTDGPFMGGMGKDDVSAQVRIAGVDGGEYVQPIAS
ncbi:MAG: hypothetical protein LQ339_005415 [Xanthoria mediterranea]|nr:MAG: hypothetical protein LQ339_005415 [Xanthoria mediterranea]